MTDIKEQLCRKYPFMSHSGTVYQSFEKEEVLQKYQGEKVLVLIIGVQGSGKTTYLQTHFSDYPVINLDEILNETLLKYRSKVMPPVAINQEVNEMFFEKAKYALRKKKIAIVDSGAIDFAFRTLVLEKLHKEYTKVVLLVLNPPMKNIVNQIRKDIERRARPDLWEDVKNEWSFLQYQIQEHFIEMGVDDVYML